MCEIFCVFPEKHEYESFFLTAMHFQSLLLILRLIEERCLPSFFKQWIDACTIIANWQQNNRIVIIVIYYYYYYYYYYYHHHYHHHCIYLREHED